MKTPSASPKVSYVLPCYNAEAFVAESVRSVLDQRFADFELIVVDDGSTDRSREIVSSLIAADPRARLITQPNQGQVSSKNRGIMESRGEYVSIVDADDWIPTNRTERMVLALDAHPEAAFAYGDAMVIGEDGRPLRHFSAIYPPIEKGHISAALFAHYCFVPLIALLFRREIFLRTGPLWSLGPRGESQDYFKLIEMGLLGEAVHVNGEVLGYYRRHSQNITAGAIEKRIAQYEIQKQSLEMLLKKHAELHTLLSKRQIARRLSRCHFMAGFYAGLAGRFDLAAGQFAKAWEIDASAVNAAAWLSTMKPLRRLAVPLYRIAGRKLY